MKKAKSKYISFMLIAVMLMNLLPAGTVTAIGTQTDLPAAQNVFSVPNSNYEEPGTVRELESRREENVKHFLLPDNTVQAVVYADAVHRMDDSGNWQDISNDLTLTEYKGVKFYTTADERLVFAEKFAPNVPLWQLSENGYSISMGMQQLQLSADAIVTPMSGDVTVTNAPQRHRATSWHSVEEARVVDNTASIVYSNIQTNTDLEYIMVGNDIKENIVVKSRKSNYSYQFQIALTGLAAAANEDGSISLLDSVTGQQQYRIPAPYMYDGAGTYSDAVSYSLEQTGAGEYSLTVTADPQWINDDNRVLPVKIDPSITYTQTQDTYINPDEPNESYGSAEYMWLFEGSAVLFKSALPTLPNGADIVSAILQVSYFYYDSVSSGEVYAGAYQILQPWEESTHTWNAANQYTNLGISNTMMSEGQLSGFVGAYESTPGWVEFDISSAVESWENGAANYGVALKYTGGTNTSVILNSAESSNAADPFFAYTYTDNRIADGVYKIQNVGNGFYLDVRDGGYTAGTVVQHNLNKSGYDYRDQLFKIAFLKVEGDDYYYSIRPMTNSGMGLSAPLTGSDRGVTIEEMSVYQSAFDIDAFQQWIITNHGSYFTLKNGTATQGGYLSSQHSSPGLQTVTRDDFVEACKWSLLNYVTQGIEGVLITTPIWRTFIGATTDLDAVMYSSDISANGPPLFFICDPDMTSTDKATIDQETGLLTAISGGTVLVGVEFVGCAQVTYYELQICRSTSTTVYAEVIYDKAYPQRYANAVERINAQMYALQEKYINEFDIWINFRTPTEFTSYADECEDIGNSPTGTCSHATDETCQNSVQNDINDFHHNNFSNITERIIRDRRDYTDQRTSFLIAYLGHDTCEQLTIRDQFDSDNDGDTEEDIVSHTINPYHGVSYDSCGLVVVSYGGEMDLSPQDWMTVETEILFHEFGHLFLAPDHYDDNDTQRIVIPSTEEIKEQTGDQSFNEVCIYGERKREQIVLDGYKICEGCKSRITANRSRYNHIGW